MNDNGNSFALSRAETYRQHIDDVVRRVAQHYAEAGRDLSERAPVLFNPIELRAGRLSLALEHIVQAAHEPDLEWVPSEQKRKVRELIQFVYQYLFGSRALSPQASNVFHIDPTFQREPIGQMLNTVRIRLSPPDQLLSVTRASEILLIGRSEGYEWTQAGIFHPVYIARGTDTLQRIELWEVLLIAKERGIAFKTSATADT